MTKHNEAIEKKCQIVQMLKDNKSIDRTFIVELLDYPHDSVRIQAAHALLFEFYKKKASALKTLKQIKKNSTNQFNVEETRRVLLQ